MFKISQQFLMPKTNEERIKHAVEHHYNVSFGFLQQWQRRLKVMRQVDKKRNIRTFYNKEDCRQALKECLFWRLETFKWQNTLKDLGVNV